MDDKEGTMTSGSLQRQASRIRPGRWRAAELVTASLFLAATLPAAAADWLSCGEVGESAQARGEDSGASARLANESLPGGTPRPGPDILYSPLAHAPQLENSGPWRARPILISGASAYRDGEFLYQDFIYDDLGAAGKSTAPATGTYTYPTDPAYAGPIAVKLAGCDD
jgi:hypothetical protein